MLRDITVISAVSADGKYFDPFSILALPKRQSTTYIFDKCPGPIVFSERGWVDYDVKLQWAEWFISKLLQDGKLKLLLCDNHISNFDDREIQTFIISNVVVMSFPAHTAHILQPLDLSCFSPFKRYVKESWDILKRKKETTHN
jgi:hypothetical protein